MSIITTEGVVIKRSNFGEADRVLTILTLHKGKIKTVARGVRRITSRRAGNVELLNRVKVRIFMGKGMTVLTEAESVVVYQKIKSDLTILTYASHIAELIDRLIVEQQPTSQIYNLVIEVLDLLESTPRQIFVRAFEVKLLTNLGFWSVSNISAKENVKSILSELETKDWSDIAQLVINKQQAEELEKVLRYYIERILESPLRSIQVMNKLRKKHNG